MALYAILFLTLLRTAESAAPPNARLHAPHVCPVTLNGRNVSNDLQLYAAVRNAPRHSLQLLHALRVPCNGFLDSEYLFRAGTSDYEVLSAIGMHHEFHFVRDLFRSGAPSTILDLGVNVGFGTMYFARQFPDAAVMGLEPGHSNFVMATMNTRQLDNVLLVHGAAWDHPAVVGVMNNSVSRFGQWGLRVEPLKSVQGMRPSQTIPAFTVPQIMRRMRWSNIDFLKIDIEGGEAVLFSDTSLASGWLANVTCLSIELHDWMTPGCCKGPFMRAMRAYDFEWVLNSWEVRVYCKRGFYAGAEANGTSRHGKRMGAGAPPRGSTSGASVQTQQGSVAGVSQLGRSLGVEGVQGSGARGAQPGSSGLPGAVKVGRGNRAAGSAWAFSDAKHNPRAGSGAVRPVPRVVSAALVGGYGMHLTAGAVHAQRSAAQQSSMASRPGSSSGGLQASSSENTGRSRAPPPLLDGVARPFVP